jgi:integrase/recombinase XerD
VAHGAFERSPAAGMKRPKVYRALPSVLTRDEVKALVFGRKGALPYTPAEYRNRVMWYVAYIAGLRASEVGRLELRQLRWEHEESVFSLVISWSKAAEGDVVMPLDDTASRLLGEYLRIRPAIFAPRAESPYLFPTALGGPIGRLRVYKLFAARVKAAGIERGKRRLTPHVLRHSIATHLLRSGCDIREVQDHLRHASIETTAVYLHTDVSRRARRLRRYRPLEEKRAPQVQVGRAMAALVADLPNL